MKRLASKAAYLRVGDWISSMESVDDINKLVQPQIRITEAILEECRAKGQFGSLVFELYKEAGGLISSTGASYLGNTGDAVRFERNQAICVGLLVRISKLMLSVVKLSSDIEHGETVEALNRCIIESSVNLKYLLLKDCDEAYDQFVKNGLRAERELYDIINQNIHRRGGKQLAIEESMLKSILDKCESLGVTIEDINLRAGSWGGNLKSRLSALGFDEGAYTVMQRFPSHAIHGTWVDLLSNHLARHDDGYEPNFDHLQTDGELLMPVACFAMDAAMEYLDKFFGRHAAGQLYGRLESVQASLVKVESSRDDWRVVGGPP